MGAVTRKRHPTWPTSATFGISDGVGLLSVGPHFPNTRSHGEDKADTGELFRP